MKCRTCHEKKSRHLMFCISCLKLLTDQTYAAVCKSKRCRNVKEFTIIEMAAAEIEAGQIFERRLHWLMCRDVLESAKGGEA